MGRFRKKPVEIEARQFVPSDTVATTDLMAWIAGHGQDVTVGVAADGTYVDEMDIVTLEDGVDSRAKHVASAGDWIIRGVQGEFYPCKPDIFAATYDLVEM